MNGATHAAGVRSAFTSAPWALWFTQGRRLTQIELRRNLLSWKAGWVYFLAFAPALFLLAHLLFDRHPLFQLEDDTRILAGIFQFYYLRLAIFFGCLGLFSRLIRGEMIERSLHFYLLAPVRREVLLLAKFAAASVSAVLLFGLAILLDFALMYAGYGAAGRDYLSAGPGLVQLMAYLLITVLACLGYGAVFLLFSMVFRNPAPAAVLLLGWEFLNPVLPSLLQKLSIAAYLRPLMPVSVAAEGIFALLTVPVEPVSRWTAVFSLLLLIIAVLGYACHRIRRLEIRYATE